MEPNSAFKMHTISLAASGVSCTRLLGLSDIPKRNVLAAAFEQKPCR
jgi:hypothetical protein